MTKTLVLHIGDPKTGSSSIQRALFDRYWDCPTVKMDYPPRLNAISLANALRSDISENSRAKRFNALADWADASTSDVLVVSAEQFSAVRPGLVQKVFAQYLPDLARTMRVVAYARPHASRLLSAYAQRTKVGGLYTDTLTFFDQLAGAGGLTYHPRFHRWRRTFGDRFTLRPMVRSQLTDNDVVADFITVALQGAPFKLLERSEANSSLTIEPLAGLRLVQSVLTRAELSEGAKHTLGASVNQRVNAVAAGKGTRLQLNSRIYKKLLQRCHPDALNLDRDFFGAPLMETELEKAAENTVKRRMDADAALYFRPQTLTRLVALGEALAAMLAAHPGEWDKDFQRKIGQKPHLWDDSLLSPATKTHLSEVDTVVTEIVSLIIPA